MQSSHPAWLLARVALAVAAMASATWARAAGLEFSAGLSPSDRAAAGVTRLNPTQVSILNALVARDVKLARDGGVTGFSSAFSARHTERELVSSGISLLTERESLNLDTLVSRVVALGPSPDDGFVYSPPQPTPPPTEAEVEQPRKTEVHGDVSFTIGGGSHGRSFYGTSADMYVTDPKHGFTVGVGFSEYRGKGLLALCGPYGPLGPYGPGYDGRPYLGW